MVATLIRQMLRGETLTVYGDGSQTRDYIFSEDLADGIVRAIEARVSGVYQLGTGRGTSLNTLIETLAAVTGLEPHVRYEDFRPGELVHTWCDVRKARNGFGFDPSTPLEEGLAQAWDWFKGHAERTHGYNTDQVDRRMH